MDGFRWLTVSPHDQPDLEFALLKPGPPMHDEETGAQIRALVAKGAIGGGVWETDDCKATFDELSARGVEFLSRAGGAAVRHRGGVPGRLRELVQPHPADRGLRPRPHILGDFSSGTTKYRGNSPKVA
jgi:hypothetical protein